MKVGISSVFATFKKRARALLDLTDRAGRRRNIRAAHRLDRIDDDQIGFHRFDQTADLVHVALGNEGDIVLGDVQADGTQLDLPHRFLARDVEHIFVLLTSPQSCSKIVDLPMPGSPPISVTLPMTIPPPRTRSSSLMPVTMRLFSFGGADAFQLLRHKACLPVTRGAAAALPEDALAGSATTSSVMVFHAPQDGQRPSQRGLVSPHWVQT